MLNLLRSSWLIFWMHLSQVLSSKRTLLCGLLAAIPPLLAWLVLRYGPEIGAEQLGCSLAWTLVLQVIVPILALVAGSGVLTEEIESRTITYIFTRPIPRAALLYGRWLATVVMVCGLLASSAWLTSRFALQGTPPGPPYERRGASYYQEHRDGAWAQRHRERDQERFRIESAHTPEKRLEFLESALRRFLVACVLGGLVYTSLFAVLGVFNRHPMIVGLGYAFAFEGIMANLPGESQTLSIQYYLRCILVAERLFAFHRLYLWSFSEFESSTSAARFLLLITLVVLGLGGYAIGRRQYVLTA